MKAFSRQTARLEAAGRIAGVAAEIRRLQSALAEAPLWGPAAALEQQCAEALRLVEAIAARLARSLVVVVIGPSGAGKSTLVNALTGGAEASPVGRRRPTTRALTVIGRSASEAGELAAELGADFVPAAAAPGLCLVDTPDTDTTEAAGHREALERAVAAADMLVCVFDAENPKRRDHADFLAPLVRRFDGRALVAVLNKCDRLEEEELRRQILPDFLAYLQAAWEGAVDRALCLSARRHLAEPAWDETARPRHAFDQFDTLRELLESEAGAGGRVVDRRVENAAHLLAWVRGEAAREAALDRPALEAARRRIAEAEQAAFAAAAEALAAANPRGAAEIDARIYREIAQRWIGPVGWLVAAWSRLIAWGGGIGTLLRPWRRRGSAGSGRPPSAAAPGEAAADEIRGRCRVAFLRHWPQAAEELVRGRFDPQVRRRDVAAAAERFAAAAAAAWAAALEREVDHAVRRLGGLALQTAANLPPVAVLAYAGWIAVREFFSGRYLPGAFFVHALWVLAVALALSFVGLQVVIRLTAAPPRLAARASARAAARLAEAPEPGDDALARQLAVVLALAPPAPGAGRGD